MEFMTLNMSNNILIEDVQNGFSDFFPYLRLKFLPVNNFSSNQYPPSKKNSGKVALKFGDLNNSISSGVVELSDATTVRELEAIFKARFGLNAQVLRKSGNLWMEVSMTRNWSLGQQNEHGREISDVH
jgi:hypothetical protein